MVSSNHFSKVVSVLVIFENAMWKKADDERFLKDDKERKPS